MYYSKWKYVNGNVPRIKDLHESLTRLIEGTIYERVTSSYPFPNKNINLIRKHLNLKYKYRGKVGLTHKNNDGDI